MRYLAAASMAILALCGLAGCGQPRTSEGEDPALLAQRTLTADPAAAPAAIDAALAEHTTLVSRLPPATADATNAAAAALASAQSAVNARDDLALIQARADYQTALLWAGYLATLDATRTGQGRAAGTWLKLRAYRPSSRLNPVDASATTAIEELISGRTTTERATAMVQTDLDGTYQALMIDAVEASVTAAFQGFRVRAAEAATRAAGYYRILRAGFANPAAGDRAFADLRTAVLAADWPAIQRARAAIAAVLAE